MLACSKAVHEFARQNEDAAKGIVRWLDKWFTKLKEIFGRTAQTSEEARLMDSLEKDVKKAFGKLWDEALREAVATHNRVGDIKNTAQEGGVQNLVRDEFAAEFDQWMAKTSEKQRRKDGGHFDLGTTPKVLVDIGAHENAVRFFKSKAQGIMDDHPEMSPDVLKQAPYIMDDPVLVMKSTTRDDSVTFVKENVTKDPSKRTFVALSLSEKSSTPNIEDLFITFSSSYGRSENNIRDMLLGTKEDKKKGISAKSPAEILYFSEDKKRTEALLRSLRVQFPSEHTVLGSIGSITYPNGEVNIEGTNIYQWQYMTESPYASDGKNSDRDYLQAVESGDMETVQRMVDEAAKKAGYTIKAYHGTTEDFTEFSRGKQGQNHKGYLEFGAGFYFSPSQKEASEWASRGKNGAARKKDSKEQDNCEDERPLIRHGRGRDTSA